MAFVDRVVQYPGRIKLTDTSDSSVLGVFDVERAEGNVVVEGSPLNANTLNAEVANIASGLVSDLTDAITVDANDNVTFRNLQAGTATVKITVAKTTVSVNVTFNQAFTKVPIVVCTPYATSPVGTTWSVANITTTGFTIYCYRTTVANVGFRWIAVSV